MVRWIAVALLLVMVISSTGICQEKSSGLYFASGGSWSGIDNTGDLGYFTSAGMWLKLGNGFYLVTPGQSEIQGADKSSISFNPFVVLEIGKFLISAGPGLTSYVKNDLALSYAQTEVSVTFLFKDPKWYETDASGMPMTQIGAPMKVGITLLGRYLPGNKYKTAILTLTLLN